MILVIMDRIRMLELLTKKKAGELTLREHLELENFLKSDAHATILSKLLHEVYETPYNYCDNVSANQVSKSLNRLHEKISVKSSQSKRGKIIRFTYWKKISAVAAAIVFIVGFVVFFQSINESKKESGHNQNDKNIVSTKKGSKSNIVLPDGSQVAINADTRIVYTDSFGKGSREVFLTGEAFFDVVKDSTKPFIVHTQNMDIKVLGTVFNVRAYTNEENDVATLLKGLIEVTLKKNTGKKIVLNPNEKIIVENVNSSPESGTAAERNILPEIMIKRIEKTPLDSAVAEIEWIKNKLVFNRDRLVDIAQTLERYFGTTITIASADLKKRRFSGTFENEDLKDILEALKISGQFKYRLDNKTWIISN